MASTKADNNRVAWTYTNNKNVDYRVSAKNVYVNDGTDGAKYGGAAAASSVARFPKGAKMRAVKLTHAGGAIWVACYEGTATLATAGTTVTRNVNGVDTVCTSTGDVREERMPYGGITDQS
jgi:hypothetical protein